MMQNWQGNINKLCEILSNISVKDYQGKELGCETGLDEWHKKTAVIRDASKCLFLIGNGASSSMASHFATDMIKNGGLRAQVFTDASLLTAVSNDLCFNEIFAEPLRWYMREGDMLVAISSSGNSPNIIKATQVARDLGGIVVTLSAMSADNALRTAGDLNFYATGTSYGHAETAHAAILHYWMDIMETNYHGCARMS